MTPELRKKVNKNFVIRVFDSSGQSRLIGAGQLHKFIGKDGEKIAKELSEEAFASDMNRYTRKLRRGIRIDFYSK